MQSPLQFELFVGSVLRSYFACEVKHVGGSGDEGVDLIAVAADRPALIQVKRRREAKSVEGVEVVKHMFATLYSKGETRGAVVTSACRFSNPAKRWLELPTIKESNIEIELIDMPRLLAMVGAADKKMEIPGWYQYRQYMLQTDISRSSS